MIRWRMDQVHVGTGALEIAREFWHGRATGFARPLKRAIVRAALQAHNENRRMYRAVMTGRF